MKTKVGLLLLLIFVAMASDCKEQHFSGYYSIENEARTENGTGAYVYSENEIPLEKLDAIDRGFTDLFAIATGKPYGYTEAINRSEYKVALFPRNKKRCVNAGFTIHLTGQPLYPDGYDQHPDFDKDREIGQVILCVAGAATDVNNKVMVIVDDVPTLSTIVKYEGEHILLYFNDSERYYETIALHAHPLLNAGELNAINDTAVKPQKLNNLTFYPLLVQ